MLLLVAFNGGKLELCAAEHCCSGSTASHDMCSCYQYLHEGNCAHEHNEHEHEVLAWAYDMGERRNDARNSGAWASYTPSPVPAPLCICSSTPVALAALPLLRGRLYLGHTRPLLS